ncbi:hypothetical protein M0R01_04915, partial [bacterium]|nr:hypothetical protein [bacterium]
HSCRVREPKLFIASSFRTLKTKTKGLTIIVGTLKATGKSALEAYRYEKEAWTPERARKHCNTRGGRFEGASTQKSCETYGDHTFMHYLWNKVKNGEEWGGWKKEEVIKEHAAITDILRNKGYAMYKKSAIDEASREFEKTIKMLTPSDIPALLQPSGEKKKKKKVKLSDTETFVNLKMIESIVNMQDFVSILKNKKDQITPQILVRAVKENINSIELEEMIRKNLPDEIKKDAVFVYNLSGADSSYVALYDLVLLPKKLEIVNLGSDSNA